MSVLSQIAQGFNPNPIGAFQQGQDQARLNVQNDLTLLNQIQAQARQREIPNLFSRASQGDQGAMGALFRVAPNAAANLMQQQENQLNRQATMQAALIKASTPPSDVRTLAYLTGKTPEQLAQDPNIRKMALSSVFGGTTIQLPGQPTAAQVANAEAAAAGVKKFEEVVGKGSGEALTTLSTEVAEGAQTLENMRRFTDTMLQSGESGPVVESTIPWLAFFSNLGVLTPEQEANLASKEAGQALGEANRLALSKFQKGAISNQEQEMMKRATTTLGNTVEGNLLLFATYEDMQRRKQIVFDRVTEEVERVRRTTGRAPNVNALINKHRAALSKEDPLLNQEFLNRVINLMPDKRAMLDSWNSSPQFVNQLRLQNVIPFFQSKNDPRIKKWVDNPNNQGQFIIIGDKLNYNQ